MSYVLVGSFLLFSSIVGFNYGLYRLGMWSQKTKLTHLKEKLLLQHPKDEDLIDEINTQIKEIDLFVNSSKIKSK
tara:strand:+ start:415 stop:639 length:225 start_codon:yes stop_codon:yes gene_type:complete